MCDVCCYFGLCAAWILVRTSCRLSRAVSTGTVERYISVLDRRYNDGMYRSPCNVVPELLLLLLWKRHLIRMSLENRCKDLFISFGGWIFCRQNLPPRLNSFSVSGGTVI